MQGMDSTAPAQNKRSQFVQKLHIILEQCEYPDDLRWCHGSENTFEITCDENRARRALSVGWNFNSLSSFIRQLSYYGFKRLSDRRRSVERKASSDSYIVFGHPSGHFVRGDDTHLDNIVRKLRARKGSNASNGSTKSRRDSLASSDGSSQPNYSPRVDLAPLHSYGNSSRSAPYPYPAPFQQPDFRGNGGGGDHWGGTLPPISDQKPSSNQFEDDAATPLRQHFNEFRAPAYPPSLHQGHPPSSHYPSFISPPPPSYFVPPPNSFPHGAYPPTAAFASNPEHPADFPERQVSGVVVPTSPGDSPPHAPHGHGHQ